MSDQFKLNIANTEAKQIEVLSLAGSEWGKNISPENFGKAYLESVAPVKASGQKQEVYYLAHKKTGKPACSLIVVHKKGFYKDAARVSGPSSTPDFASFGVKTATFLRITMVVTAPEYRKLGLANTLIKQVISQVEKRIVKEELDKSDDKPESFKSLVTTDGKIDDGLVKYHLGKKYFWTLYSAVGDYYERFGFKGYPLSFYKVPTSIVSHHHDDFVGQLIRDTTSSDPSAVGKRLRLLSGEKPQDRDLISFLLAGRELEIMTELNKAMFHTELVGSHKSASSMTNITNMLAMTKITAAPTLSDVAEDGSGNKPRRKSSAQQSNVPKVAVKPELSDFERFHLFTQSYRSKMEKPIDGIKFSDIEGAILTNDLQQKSHMIIWVHALGKTFVVQVGELQFDLLRASVSPIDAAPGGTRGRRASSSVGLNELGGYNFQDLDILFSVACYVNEAKGWGDSSAIYVSYHDLPSTIPAPVLNDYFTHYLPRTFEGVEVQESKNEKDRVELIKDASSDLHILPMLKRFGNDSPHFEIDWVSNGMLSWG